MKRYLIHVCALFVALSPAMLSAQSMKDSSAGDDIYVQLVDATHFIDNYKEMAAVSAQVFSVRNQGSDRQYAQFMAFMAHADLSDIKACVAKNYADQMMTEGDARELVEIFKSPIGEKILRLSQQMVIDDIRHGAPQGADVSGLNALSSEDRQQLLEIRSTPSFVHYGQVTTSSAFRAGVGHCLLGSKAAKASGMKL
jgi:hypothetical protein